MSRAAAWRTLREARARKRLEQARQAAEEGRQAVARLRLGQAEDALRRALGHFAAAQELPRACQGAYDAARDLAFLHWQRQDLEPARRWRAAAAGLATPAIDPTRYPPEFVAFWNASDHAPPAIPITIAVKPTEKPDATHSAPAAEPVQVWVNCKAVGRAPAAVTVRGAALVTLAQGRRSASELVEPDRSQLHEIALPPGDISSEEATLLLKTTGAPALLWVKRDRAGWTVHRFSPGSGWQRRFRRIPNRAAPPPPREQRRPDRREPSRPAPVLGWVLSGAAAGALATGVVTGLLAHSAADEIERKAAADELFDPADESANRRFRIISYTTLAVGGALATAAVVYWVWRAWHPAPRRPAAGLELRGPGLVLSW